VSSRIAATLNLEMDRNKRQEESQYENKKPDHDESIKVYGVVLTGQVYTPRDLLCPQQKVNTEWLKYHYPLAFLLEFPSISRAVKKIS
jgi:hypothetical protein